MAVLVVTIRCKSTSDDVVRRAVDRAPRRFVLQPATKQLKVC